MKTKFSTNLTLLLILLSVIIAISCGKDVIVDDEENKKTSYVEFTITHADGNKEEFVFKDETHTDDFNATGNIWPKLEHQVADHFDVKIYNNNNTNRFGMVGIAIEESNTYVNEGRLSDSPTYLWYDSEDKYYAKKLSYTVEELKSSENRISKCKVTFSGSFSKNGTDEEATINGKLAYNQ